MKQITLKITRKENGFPIITGVMDDGTEVVLKGCVSAVVRISGAETKAELEFDSPLLDIALKADSNDQIKENNLKLFLRLRNNLTP